MGDFAFFVDHSTFDRGEGFDNGVLSGQLNFRRESGGASTFISFIVVLAN